MNAPQPARTPRRPLVPVAVAIGTGIAADRWLAIGLAGWWLACGGLIAWWLLRRGGRDAAAAVALLSCFAAVAAGWHHAAWRLYGGNELGRYAQDVSAPVCLEAVATDSPRSRTPPPPSPLRAIPATDSTELALRACRLRVGDRWLRVSGRTLLVVDGDLAGVRAGDTVRVHGKFRVGAEPLNPGEFDYAAYLRADRRLAIVQSPSPDCVEVVEQGGWTPWRAIAHQRTIFARRLARRLGPDRAPIAQAILLGSRRAVDDDTVQAFRRTGSLHVLVVSGLHVGLVVSLLCGAAGQGWLARWPTLVVVMLLIAAYAALTGARPPVVRAALLGQVLCLAAITGRPLLSLNSLAGAAALVLAWNPAELFRTGAQLSFLAAATLIAFTAYQATRPGPTAMDRLIASLRPAPVRLGYALLHWAGMLLAATLAVWLVAAPLVLNQFHLISPIALPLSLVVFPLVAAIVGGGVVLLATEALLPLLSPVVAGCVGWAIDLLVGVVRWADSAPAAFFWQAGPAGWWTIGVYFFLGALLLAVGWQAQQRWLKLTACWVVVGVAVAALTSQRPPSLRATFIAVGHGCSVLVETPTGETLLYDAGSLGSPDAAADTISGVLWSKGVTRLDAVVLSHADVDHFNAAPALLERFEVGSVCVSPVVFEEVERRPNSAPATLLRAIGASGVPLVELRQGDRLNFGPTTALVLHPGDAWIDDSDNARSLVLAIEHAGRRLLLPGDLEGVGLEDVIAQDAWDCDVLLAPHHGSRRSDPPGFAAWSTPEWVIVSGGAASVEGVIGGDAGSTYRAAGAQVLRTADRGAVQVEFKPNGVAWSAFRKTWQPIRLP